MEDFHKTAVDILANDSNDQRLIFPPTYSTAWNGFPAQLHAWQARWVKIGPLSANKGMQMQIESFSNSSKLLFSVEGSWQSSDTARKFKSGSDCAWKWASVWRDVRKQREAPPAMKSTMFDVIRSKLWIGSIYSKKTEWYSCLLIFQTHSSRACKENTFQNWHGLFCGSCEPTQQRWILHFTWSSFPFQMREKNSQNYEYNKGIWYWIQPIIGTCQKLDLEHKKWAVESHY